MSNAAPPAPKVDECQQWASAAEFFWELEQLHAAGRPDEFVLCAGPVGADGLCQAHRSVLPHAPAAVI